MQGLISTRCGNSVAGKEMSQLHEDLCDVPAARRAMLATSSASQATAWVHRSGPALLLPITNQGNSGGHGSQQPLSNGVPGASVSGPANPPVLPRHPLSNGVSGTPTTEPASPPLQPSERSRSPPPQILGSAVNRHLCLLGQPPSYCTHGVTQTQVLSFEVFRMAEVMLIRTFPDVGGSPQMTRGGALI